MMGNLTPAAWAELVDAAREYAHLGPTAVDTLNAMTDGRFDHIDLERALAHVRAYPRAASIAELPPTEPVVWAVADWATACEPVLVVGDDGGGKSTILTAVLAAHAAGALAFDRFGAVPGPVLLISEEDRAEVIANHVAAIVRGHGWDWNLVRARFHILALAGVQLDEATWAAHVLEEVARLRPVAVGLDPLADLSAGEENSNDETRPVKRLLRQIGMLGATPYVVHHAGKAVEGKRKRDRVRGASALLAAVRSAWWIEPCQVGIMVECLKLSRAERPEPFVVSRDIETDPDNPGAWHTARLAYVSAHQAEEDAADRFVLDTLARYPFTMSTEIREMAKGTGISAPQIAASVQRLRLLRRIAFRPGKRNSKRWYRPDVTNLPENVGQVGQANLPNLPEPAGQTHEGSDDPAHLHREGRVGQELEPAGQARRPTPDDGDYRCVECNAAEVGGAKVRCAGCQYGEEAA
jgi:hypothetical protein